MPNLWLGGSSTGCWPPAPFVPHPCPQEVPTILVVNDESNSQGPSYAQRIQSSPVTPQDWLAAQQRTEDHAYERDRSQNAAISPQRDARSPLTSPARDGARSPAEGTSPGKPCLSPRTAALVPGRRQTLEPLQTCPSPNALDALEQLQEGLTNGLADERPRPSST